MLCSPVSALMLSFMLFLLLTNSLPRSESALAFVRGDLTLGSIDRWIGGNWYALPLLLSRPEARWWWIIPSIGLKREYLWRWKWKSLAVLMSYVTQLIAFLYSVWFYWCLLDDYILYFPYVFQQPTDRCVGWLHIATQHFKHTILPTWVYGVMGASGTAISPLMECPIVRGSCQYSILLCC